MNNADIIKFDVSPLIFDVMNVDLAQLGIQEILIS